VEQSAGLLSGTIRDNIAYGKVRDIDIDIDLTLDMCKVILHGMASIAFLHDQSSV
jgi:ABC-type multidrug transport system fused ATPase/permease subunit